MANYAEVIVPLPVQGTYTYLIPDELEGQVCRGSRVYVQFGRRKFYTGIVKDLHSNTPAGYEVKPITAVFELDPIVRHPQIKFWQWLSDYYLCSLGETDKAAVPTGLKVESETCLTLNDDADIETLGASLTRSETALLDKVSVDGGVRMKELEDGQASATLARNISKLLSKGLVVADQKVTTTYRPKKINIVLPGGDTSDSEWLHKAFDSVARSLKQEVLLLAFLDLIKGKTSAEVERDELLKKANVSTAILKALVGKGILRIESKIINRFKQPVSNTVELPPLTRAQREALWEIEMSWKDKGVTLLHGVTGSGKTEIYCHAIRQALDARKQALFLVPEIGLTTQLTDRLRRIFGDRLLVYHSKFSDSERVDIWQRLRYTHEPLVVLGVRSSIFLPFAQLGLVVIDEEHESSYKQYDPAPRYNARDAAIMLASMHGAKTLLGSATPAIDTYYKATTGKYGLVTLTERFQGATLPEVKVVDMVDHRKKRLTDGLLSAPLSTSINHTLAAGRQAIMFQNRRGFAPSVYCTQCGWQPKCVNCDVSLVYHKRADALSCHYCGYQTSLPRLCPACGQNSVRQGGFGTERIADHISERFPQAKVSRMDLDTTRNKDAYQRIIEDFSHQRTDILIGTQMVSKGLDFANVSLVGVTNADSLLHFPDFRANERAFNMLVQVAGRAGRREQKGEVIIQTDDAAHPLLDFICRQDYAGYYEYELEQRRLYNYPPFTKIIMLYIKHRDSAEVMHLSQMYAERLRKILGERVLGPASPPIGRIANYYIRSIMLKVEKEVSMSKVKALLQSIFAEMAADPRMKTAQVYYDVDPA